METEEVEEGYAEEGEQYYDEELVGEEEEEDDESDDDDVGLLKPAFDLQALKIQEDAMKSKSNRQKLDLSGPPADGLEYLLQVRKEARNVPDVVVAKSITFANTTTEIVSPPCKECRVIGETQRKQLSSFASARRMVLDARSSHLANGTLPVPMKTGEEANEEETEESEEMDVEERSSDDRNSASFCEKLDIERKQPLITTMLTLDQYELSDLLDEFADKVSELPQQSPNIMQSSQPWPLGRWIFSSLAAVDEPAPAEALAAMRNLATRCLEVSNAFKKTQEQTNSESILVDLELFLLIVVLHFKQSDLIDIISE